MCSATAYSTTGTAWWMRNAYIPHGPMELVLFQHHYQQSIAFEEQCYRAGWGIAGKNSHSKLKEWEHAATRPKCRIAERDFKREETMGLKNYAAVWHGTL